MTLIFAQNKIIQIRKKAVYTLWDIKGQKPIDKEEGNYFFWSIITHAITQNLERKNRHSLKLIIIIIILINEDHYLLPSCEMTFSS